ncbi:MAG: hypothetical protein N2645_08325 [Clostridia bacterium]|nr:hypothetical protein [Clostridia bacterium]
MNTSYFEISTQKGSLWCAYDYLDSHDKGSPLVIVAPGYEKTARDSLMISKYLVLNGFRVLRFDASNCCGLSSGSIEKFTLSGLTEDIRNVVRYSIMNLKGVKPLALVSLSLSSRCVLKYLATALEDIQHIEAAVSIVGVVDVRYTIAQITGVDYFKQFDEGNRFGVRKMLTYEIDWDCFASDSLANHYDSLETAREDAKRLKLKHYCSIFSEKDEWNDVKHQQSIQECFRSTNSEQLVIEGASHQIWKNPRSGEIAMKNCVGFIKRHLLGSDESGYVLKPNITEVIELNRKERKVILNWPKSTGKEVCEGVSV